MPNPTSADPVFSAEAAARGAEVRHRFRSGAPAAHTSGLADDLVQGNLVVLPREARHALPALLPAQPAPCPLLAVGDARQPGAAVAGRPTSTCAPTCRATGSGATARWWTSPPTSAPCGATTW
jgi:uncharacterized protein YcsI (UPF0317 family)